MGFGLLKGEKNRRCSAMGGWKLPHCRQNGFTAGIFGWFSLLCLGPPRPQSPELGFSKPPKQGVEAGNVAPPWAASSKGEAAGRAPGLHAAPCHGSLSTSLTSPSCYGLIRICSCRVCWGCAVGPCRLGAALALVKRCGRQVVRRRWAQRSRWVSSAKAATC